MRRISGWAVFSAFYLGYFVRSSLGEDSDWPTGVSVLLAGFYAAALAVEIWRCRSGN